MRKTGTTFAVTVMVASCLFVVVLPAASRHVPAGSRSTMGGAPYPIVDPGFLSALEWRSVGPFRGGRVTAVAGDPDDPLVFYMGTAHGGVWKTIDAGTYWRNVSDGFFKRAPVGAIDVSRSNHNVIYVGTGESEPRQDLTPGDGVYKSTDGGQTWTNVGLEGTAAHLEDPHPSDEPRHRLRGSHGRHLRRPTPSAASSGRRTAERRGSGCCSRATGPCAFDLDDGSRPTRTCSSPRSISSSGVRGTR